MRKLTLLFIASIMVLCLASCDKDVINKTKGLETEDIISLYGEDKDVLLSRMKRYRASERDDGGISFTKNKNEVYIKAFGYSGNFLTVDISNNSVSGVSIMNRDKYTLSIYYKVKGDLKRLYPDYEHEETSFFLIDMYKVTVGDMEIRLSYNGSSSGDNFMMIVEGVDDTKSKSADDTQEIIDKIQARMKETQKVIN